MTVRKGDNLLRGDRTPAYVNRERVATRSPRVAERPIAAGLAAREGEQLIACQRPEETR
jgi:hypothetical protein